MPAKPMGKFITGGTAEAEASSAAKASAERMTFPCAMAPDAAERMVV